MMNLYRVFEWLVVGGALIFSARAALRVFFPKSARRLARGLRGLGMPAPVADSLTQSASCDDGCHACSKCDAAPSVQAVPIVMHKSRGTGGA